jgi:hypothetical protein
MTNQINQAQTARLLAFFLIHASEKGEISDRDEFFTDIARLFSNGNMLENLLFELNDEGIVYYELIGEDGFAPITLVGITKRTAVYLSDLLEKIDNDMIDVKGRLKEILTFDQEQLVGEISHAEAQLKDVRKVAEANDLLKPLLGQITVIKKHFHSAAAVVEKYEDVYKNIIRPVQLEGESGLKRLSDGQSSALQPLR